MAESSGTVFFVGALPPPVGGQSHVNELIATALAPRCRLIMINTAAKGLERSMAYHCQRLLRVYNGVAVILGGSVAGDRLYVSTDGGLGLLYNLVLVALGRLKRCSIFLHHHSFSYIDRRSRLMALLVAAAGKRATHIFLCGGMRERFKSQYAFRGPSIVCSNAFFVSPKSPGKNDYAGDRPLRVGLLSHLSSEKGLYEFLALLRVAKERSLPIRGVLAGPPVSPADSSAIAKAQRELQEHLDFRGPLYGSAKDEFYDEIDVFLFPTRFRVESYGLVVVEALAHGVPVVSYARGCIDSYLQAPAGYVIPSSADFIPSALGQLERWLTEPATYRASRSAAWQLSHRLHAEAEGGVLELLSLLAEAPSLPGGLRPDGHRSRSAKIHGDAGGAEL